MLNKDPRVYVIDVSDKDVFDECVRLLSYTPLKYEIDSMRWSLGEKIKTLFLPTDFYNIDITWSHRTIENYNHRNYTKITISDLTDLARRFMYG